MRNTAIIALGAGVTVEDVRWLLSYLSPVTDEEWRALRASGAAESEIDIFARSIRDRIGQLRLSRTPAGPAPSILTTVRTRRTFESRAAEGERTHNNVVRLIRNLILPYQRSLALVLSAMLVETMMSLAGPWPLKIILDNVAGSSHLPRRLAHLLTSLPGAAGKTQIALWAGAAVVLIAAIGAVASYPDSYLTRTSSRL